MTSVLEQFVLSGLALNDEVKLTLEEVAFTPTAKKPQFATNADADGEVLVRESHYTNAALEGTVRVTPAATADAAREALGKLTDALQECERIEGGAPLEWTPAQSVRTYTGYVLSAEYTEIPITAAGDSAGWLFKAPLVKFKLTMRPFLYTPERVAKALTESGAEPLQILYVGGIKGDVPAEATLIVKDSATQNRRFAAFGRDVVFSETGLPPLLLPASTSLVTTGFGGESKTRSGAYGSEKVIRATAVGSASTICGTGRISNVGTFAVYLRCYATSQATRFRISYRNGDGPIVPLPWQQPPLVNGYAELYMGEVFFDEVELGSQTSEIRVEHRTSDGSWVANDVNYLMLWPTTKGSCKARGPADKEPTNLIGYDFFEQTAGNLEGRTPNLGPAWVEVNKSGAKGFQVNSSGRYLERTALEDSNTNSGCFALLGSATYGSAWVQANVLAGTQLRVGAGGLGALARYASTTKWVYAVVTLQLVGSEYNQAALTFGVYKNVSGTLSQLGATLVGSSFATSYPYPTPYTLPQSHQIVLKVAADGTWAASYDGVQLQGFDADFAPGGALETGKVGIYDAMTSASATARYIDNFILFGTEEAPKVCYSGRQLQFYSEGVQRQDATGVYDGPPAVARGANLFLEPAGAAGAVNRIAVRMRRNDVEIEEDAPVNDKLKTEVLVRERFLIPR